MFAGIIDHFQVLDAARLKRLAVVFDEIRVAQIDLALRALTVVPSSETTAMRADIEWLIDRRIVRPAPGSSAVYAMFANYSHDPSMQRKPVTSFVEYGSPEHIEELEAMRHMLDGKLQSILSDSEIKEIVGSGDFFGGLDLRLPSIWIRSVENSECVPVLQAYSAEAWRATTKADVAHLVLNEIPQPSEDTPWEEVMAFREEEQIALKHSRLKNWINDVARLRLPIHELQEKYQQLVYEYQMALKIAKIKFEKATMHVIVSTTAEVIEDLVKVKWKKLTDIPFEIRKEAAELLEAEHTATGREVAYILKAQERFNGSA